MKSNIFIPEKINVGFQNRNGTYTGKLSYIIYFDQKGVLRKEKSWDSWRDKAIDNIIHKNTPTTGFVLNKKAGGYSTGWNHRQTYVRVYDPRGFEFEISIPNLLYILENTNSIKGKGLEGEFVYGWDGTELILIPTSSPDYIEISNFNKIIHANKNVKAKDLVIGATYKTKQNKEWIYMGKFDYYRWGSVRKKQFWFYDVGEKRFTQIGSLGDKIIDTVDINCCSNYADLFDELECSNYYSPIDENNVEHEEYDLDYFIECINNKVLQNSYFWATIQVYCDLKNDSNSLIRISRKNRESNLLKATKKSKKIEKYKPYLGCREYEREVEYDEIVCESENIEEIYDKLKPKYKNIYLKNGKLKGGIKNNE